MTTKTWPYGTQRRGEILYVDGYFLAVKDDCKEGHILGWTGHDKNLKVGDRGLLTFTQGGPTGGFWRFEKDEKRA